MKFKYGNKKKKIIEEELAINAILNVKDIFLKAR